MVELTMLQPFLRGHTGIGKSAGASFISWNAKAYFSPRISAGKIQYSLSYKQSMLTAILGANLKLPGALIRHNLGFSHVQNATLMIRFSGIMKI